MSLVYSHPKVTVTQIAQMCHEANRAIQAAGGQEVGPAWADAPSWQCNSAIEGVRFALNNPGAPASAQHDAWSASKAADGWVYGPVKDADAKTHPCLVPYDELPAIERAKDHVFRAIVHTAASFRRTDI